MLLPHPVENARPVQLRGRERNVQYWRHNLERQLPMAPELAEQVERDDCLRDGANECSEACGAEEAREEPVRVGVDAIQDDGEMRKKFGYDVERSYVVTMR